MDQIRLALRWIGVLVLGISIAACGGGDGGDSGSSPTPGGQTNNPPPTSNTPPPASNSSPTIDGEPTATVLVGQAYDFRPSASDADGDDLTFSADNLPDWATLDERTGRISGTPSAEDIATFSGITITVSDGRASSSLGPFSITVASVGTGSATLSWVPPTENADGSPLTNLAGYEIRYGRDRSELSESVVVNNPSLSIYVLDNLTTGTWYFAVAALNTEGVASSLSNIASKTIT